MMHFTTLKLMKDKLPCPIEHKGESRTFKFAEINAPAINKTSKKALTQEFNERPEFACFVSKLVWGQWRWIFQGDVVV